ncbi:hypothetical protein BDBG_16834 [Blastomyces gilchristii SLH14081]|uniref:Uncharacterized protein n=1 Tax=Blastomyces gilchristii (strain SLH14081) TaxID=559298 RepID=A0A179UHD7_BLAGS|nr:uncharacterized protein BDBG_16834 [Blastomyces gilchristii SLH14081]OAT07404.1 hypothetical protein BDBG_16834 [Blastomyces gilchristii SLH14081]
MTHPLSFQETPSPTPPPKDRLTNECMSAWKHDNNHSQPCSFAFSLNLDYIVNNTLAVLPAGGFEQEFIHTPP